MCERSLSEGNIDVLQHWSKQFSVNLIEKRSVNSKTTCSNWYALSPSPSRHFHIWKHLIKTQTSWWESIYSGTSEADMLWLRHLNVFLVQHLLLPTFSVLLMNLLRFIKVCLLAALTWGFWNFNLFCSRPVISNYVCLPVTVQINSSCLNFNWVQ